MMKPQLLFLLTFLPFLSFAQAPTDTVDIPDPNFKWALLHHTLFDGNEIDTNGDGEIEYGEAAVMDSLIVGDANINQQIQDMTGIEAFANITYLRCYNNTIGTLDLSQNTLLEQVECEDNLLTSLILGDNPNLTYLQCEGNQLTSLDVSQNTGLETLKCYDNNLTTLQVSQSLKLLACANNQLITLDLSQDTSLISFGVENNHLSSLNIKNNNNGNIIFFSTENNPNLTCIFVDDKAYCENSPYWHIDSNSHYVETQEECDALGVNNYKAQKLTIYPNPVQNKLYIRANQGKIGKVTLFDLQGRKLLFKNVHQSLQSLDFSSFSPGVYFLRISYKNTESIQKIIKL